MNLPVCHREERSDVAIQLESWIAAPSFLGLAMTTEGVKQAA
jgi:hypothetical protein